MPNWCENHLTVSGEPKAIARFRDSARGSDTDLSLHKLYPMPKELEGTRSPGDTPNWYDWCVKHWGTKWDVTAVLDIESDDCLEYVFDSAWAPPVSWLDKVSRDFPTLEFRLKFDEPGMSFMGCARALNGLTRDQAVDY